MSKKRLLSEEERLALHGAIGAAQQQARALAALNEDARCAALVDEAIGKANQIHDSGGAP